MDKDLVKLIDKIWSKDPKDLTEQEKFIKEEIKILLTKEKEND